MPADPDVLTPEEATVVASLRRLAKKWPPTLLLLSMNGSLQIFHTGDERLNSQDPTYRQEGQLATIQGIPNDGGDW